MKTEIRSGAVSRTFWNLEKNLDMREREGRNRAEHGGTDGYKKGAGDMMNFRLAPTIGSFWERSTEVIPSRSSSHCTAISYRLLPIQSSVQSRVHVPLLSPAVPPPADLETCIARRLAEMPKAP